MQKLDLSDQALYQAFSQTRGLFTKMFSVLQSWYYIYTLSKHHLHPKETVSEKFEKDPKPGFNCRPSEFFSTSNVPSNFSPQRMQNYTDCLSEKKSEKGFKAGFRGNCRPACADLVQERQI